MSKKTKEVKAEHGAVVGKPSFMALMPKVTAAVQEDPRFDTDKHGQQEGTPGDIEPYCCDVLVPDDDGKLWAVVRTDDGRCVKHGFVWDGTSVVMDEGESAPCESAQVWAKEGFAKLMEQVWPPNMAFLDATVRAAYASDRGKVALSAHKASAFARGVSKKAKEVNDGASHTEAAAAHDQAGRAHKEAAGKWRENGDEGDEDLAEGHEETAAGHAKLADEHRKESARVLAAKAAEAKQPTVHCRDCGVPLVLAAEKKWEHGKPVEFQWMPGGRHTITATYDGKPIVLTVECDADTAQTVKASFERAVATTPRRRPFGCVEHREEERAFDPQAFFWKQDGEDPGVYCSAVPSELGARNVMGAIHSSFSPAFTTDAEYAKAKEEGGALVFPDGARGSASNPARVLGVGSKSVGSLTNWPAFRNILPVTAKEAEVKAGAPDGQVVHESATRTAKATEPDAPTLATVYARATANRAALESLAARVPALDRLLSKVVRAGAPMGNQNAAGPHDMGGDGPTKEGGGQRAARQVSDDERKALPPKLQEYLAAEDRIAAHDWRKGDPAKEDMKLMTTETRHQLETHLNVLRNARAAGAIKSPDARSPMKPHPGFPPYRTRDIGFSHQAGRSGVGRI